MNTEKITSILVPCDFSEASKRAIAWAATLQRSVGGAKAHVLFVWNMTPDLVASIPFGQAGPGEADLRGVERELQAMADQHGLAADVSVEVASDAGAAIVDRAAAFGCDLIAMGTHGRGGLARAVLGSAADWVVRRAPCPVVVIRAGGTARA